MAEQYSHKNCKFVPATLLGDMESEHELAQNCERKVLLLPKTLIVLSVKARTCYSPHSPYVTGTELNLIFFLVLHNW